MFPNVETNKIRYKSELKFKLIEKKRQIKNLDFSPNYALRFAAYIHKHAHSIGFFFIWGVNLLQTSKVYNYIYTA